MNKKMGVRWAWQQFRESVEKYYREDCAESGKKAQRFKWFLRDEYGIDKCTLINQRRIIRNRIKREKLGVTLMSELYKKN
jgi:hypothetical protein